MWAARPFGKCSRASACLRRGRGGSRAQGRRPGFSFLELQHTAFGLDHLLRRDITTLCACPRKAATKGPGPRPHEGGNAGGAMTGRRAGMQIAAAVLMISVGLLIPVEVLADQRPDRLILFRGPGTAIVENGHPRTAVRTSAAVCITAGGSGSLDASLQPMAPTWRHRDRPNSSADQWRNGRSRTGRTRQRQRQDFVPDRRGRSGPAVSRTRHRR